MEIRSYRAVFDLERRIYRIDRLRLNPSGIPVRSVLYFVAILLAMLLLGSLPLVGLLLEPLPWYVRELALPAGGAALLTVIRIEGRPSHQAAGALLRYALGPRWLSGLRAAGPMGSRWRPPDLVLLPDGSDPRLRRMRYHGPGAVLVRPAHERWGRTRLHLRELPGVRAPARAQVIVLPRRARLDVRPGVERARGGRDSPHGRAERRGRPGRDRRRARASSAAG